MSRIHIPDEAHGNDDTVLIEDRAGRVFLNLHTKEIGEHHVFLTVEQARRVAAQIYNAAQAAEAGQ